MTPRLHPNEIRRLEERIREKICAVCIDRKPDGSCDPRNGGDCTLMEKLPEAARAVLGVTSDRIEPYIEALRQHVCSDCLFSQEDGSCIPRDTDRCVLNSYFPLFVDAIEEHFGRNFSRAIVQLRPRSN